MTIYPFNISKTSPSNPQSPFDLNNPISSNSQHGPYSAMFSKHLFEGDHPENKSFEFNILTASENLVILILT